MEGKLIKQEKEYYALYTNKGIFISDVNGGSLANRLSLKNCEAIENDYDLDELAENNYPIFNLPLTNTTTINALKQDSFKEGFQKALEILGDKKFSEEDVKKTLYLKNGFDKDGFSFYKSDEEIIQSLQQTEWDVVVEMDIDNPCPKCGEKDNVHGNYDYSNITRPLINTLCNECGTYFLPIPKLDADGCLILKRKS